MHIYKFRLVRYRWWFVATFVNKGFINVNCKENFVFSPVLQVSKYTPTTLDTLGCSGAYFQCTLLSLQVHAETKNVCLSWKTFHTINMNRPMKISWPRLLSCIFYIAFILSVENEHAVSNTFFKRTSRFCCRSVCNSVSKAKSPSKLSVSGPESLDMDSIMSKHDVEKFMEMK